MTWSHPAAFLPGASPFALLHREMDRFFEEALGQAERRVQPSPAPSFTPRFDVAETDEALCVRLEVPGLEEKDLELSLTGELLVVKGEKRRPEAPENARWHRVETVAGRFERALRLPCEVRADAVKAACEKGILSITLPKATPRGASRRIEVTSR